MGASRSSSVLGIPTEHCDRVPAPAAEPLHVSIYPLGVIGATS